MLVPLPLGDVLDRITILRLKTERIADPAKVALAQQALDALSARWTHGPVPEEDDLFAVNARLWEVEDALREHEARGDFGPDFVALARSVYKLNDRRAALKRAVDVRLGSAFTEVKEHAPYDAD